MNTILAILGFIVMSVGALTLFVGIIFSNFGICGPAPDALVVAGVLSFLAGLGAATPWLVAKAPLKVRRRLTSLSNGLRMATQCHLK